MDETKAENQINYRSLNNYRFSDYDIEAIKQYIIHGRIQNGIDTIPQQKKYANIHENFLVRRDKLVYQRGLTTLEVVHKDEVNRVLSNLYKNKAIGMGHGIQQFYQIVVSKYLNITRREVEEFLKAQFPYQLTRKYIQAKNPTKKFTRPNIVWAIDLIDMSNYERHNRHFKYIMSVLDLFSKHCYLHSLKQKTPAIVLYYFKMSVNANNGNAPRLLISDNGKEFKSEFAIYLRASNIKVQTTKSYSPQPDIENFNGQIRKMISELFVRNNRLVWINDLRKIQDNLNHYNDLPVNRMKREQRDEIAERRRNKFNIGNTVRIRQSAILSKVRKAVKENLAKHIHVKYSVDTFVIFKLYRPKAVNGFYFYGLTTDDENRKRIHNTDGTICQFREIDLMGIERSEGRELTVLDSNKLNQI